MQLTNDRISPPHKPISLVPIENLLSHRHKKFTNDHTAFHQTESFLLAQLEDKTCELESRSPNFLGDKSKAAKGTVAEYLEIKAKTFKELETENVFNNGTNLSRKIQVDEQENMCKMVSVNDISLKASTPGTSEFEMSLDRAFTSTKQDISASTNCKSGTPNIESKTNKHMETGCRDSSRGTSSKPTPKAGHNLDQRRTPRSFSKTPRTVENKNTIGGEVPNMTLNRSYSRTFLTPKSLEASTIKLPVATPRNLTKTPSLISKRRQLVASTPLSLGEEHLQSQTIKEETQPF